MAATTKNTTKRRPPTKAELRRHEALERQLDNGAFETPYDRWVMLQELAEILWDKTNGAVQLLAPLDFPQHTYETTQFCMFTAPPERPHMASLQVNFDVDDIDVGGQSVYRRMRRELTALLHVAEQSLAALAELESDWKSRQKVAPVYVVFDSEDDGRVILQTSDREAAWDAARQYRREHGPCTARVDFTRCGIRFRDRPILTPTAERRRSAS